MLLKLLTLAKDLGKMTSTEFFPTMKNEIKQVKMIPQLIWYDFWDP